MLHIVYSIHGTLVSYLCERTCILKRGVHRECAVSRDCTYYILYHATATYIGKKRNFSVTATLDSIKKNGCSKFLWNEIILLLCICSQCTCTIRLYEYSRLVTPTFTLFPQANTLGPMLSKYWSWKAQNWETEVFN